MKIILITGIFTALFLIICTDDFLSKFHQRDYKIKDLFVQSIYTNEKYIEKWEIKTFKYNRSVTAFNATLITRNDTKDEVELLVQAYKRTSNAYRMFPIRFQVNLCKMYKHDVAGFSKIIKYGNFTNSCQIKKGLVYHIYNFVVDESMLPPFIPTGEYKLEATTLFLDEPLAVLIITGQVYHPTPTPK